MAKLALLGDSMIDTGLDKANFRTLNRWLSGPLVSLLGPAFEDYYNHGVGGDAIADCLARVGDIESDAEYVLVECGINDLSRDDTTLDSMKDGYENIIRALKVAGKTIICATILERIIYPSQTYTDAEAAAINERNKSLRLEFNVWLRTIKDNGTIDGLADIGRDRFFSPADNAQDGTHPDTDQCVRLGGIIASAIIKAGPTKVGLGPNLLVTPQLMGNGGTSSSAHISGDIATGWRWLDVQTGTEEILCDTIMSGNGGSQKMTFSGAPSGGAVGDFFRDNQSSVDLLTGQTVMTSFKVRTEALKGVIGIYSQLSLPLAAGTQYVSAMYVGPTDAGTVYRQVPSDMTETFYSIPYTATENLTGCTFRIAFYYLNGAELSGSATISEPQVRLVL